jgi:hypothetical protein
MLPHKAGLRFPVWVTNGVTRDKVV